jgi:hypothetical protein
VLRLFEAADFLESSPGRDLLRHVFRVVEGHRVDQSLVHRDGAYVVGPAIFRCVPGIGLEARVDARVLDVVLECDGRRPLGELVAASALRRADGDADGSFEGFVEAQVRHLVERGFTVPVTENRLENKGET